jgi:hypothetical protein
MNKIVLLSLILFSCTTLKLERTNGNVPTVGITIQVSNTSQIEIADSLSKNISQRIELISQERKDYKLGNGNTSNDYNVVIKIEYLKTVDTDRQHEKEIIRNKLESTFDSTEDRWKEEKDKLVAINNGLTPIALLIPSPFANSIGVAITIKEIAQNRAESKMIASTFSFAGVAYSVEILDKNKKIIWKKSNTQKLTLNYVMSETEQKRILVRNIGLFLEDKVPIFKIKT